MEPTTIFLSACVIVLIYLVYYTYTFNATMLLSSMTPANSTTTITPPVPADGQLANNFTFSIWININDWSTNLNFYKNIISYGNSVFITLEPTNNNIHVAFNQDNKYKVISNIPLQTWTHLVFCLNGRTLDTYLNGKLVSTQMCGINAYTPPNPNATITLGGGNAPSRKCNSIPDPAFAGCSPYYTSGNSGPNPGFSGWITQFQYSPEPTEPQSVWNLYKQGNGIGIFSNLFGNYGLSIALTNNGIAQNTISI